MRHPNWKFSIAVICCVLLVSCGSQTILLPDMDENESSDVNGNESLVTNEDESPDVEETESLDMEVTESTEQEIFSDKELTPFLGTWIYEISWNDGGTRKFIIDINYDDNDQLFFNFIQNHYSYYPFFIEYSIDDGQLESNYKLVLKDDHTDVSEYRLNVVLYFDEGELMGVISPSWKDSEKVLLEKQQ